MIDGTTAMQMIVPRQKELEDLEVTEQCKTEIQAILDKYGCRLEVAMFTKLTGNTPQIAIVRNR